MSYTGPKYIIVTGGVMSGVGKGVATASIGKIIQQYGYDTNINFQKVITEADIVMEYLVSTAPVTAPINILTGLHKLFAGFEKPIIKASNLYGIEYSSLIFELGNRKLIAGQEDLILEIAQNLKKRTNYDTTDNGNWKRLKCP